MMAAKMAPQPPPRFDYGALDRETRRLVEDRAGQIHQLARKTAAGIALIGEYLTDVKAQLKHGQFLEWIDREFAWKEWTAQQFMKVYKCSKTVNFTDLEMDVSALYLIAAPSTPEPVRAPK